MGVGVGEVTGENSTRGRGKSVVKSRFLEPPKTNKTDVATIYVTKKKQNLKSKPRSLTT